ncbi:MAG: hypothetical protein ACNA8N_02705 [Trueperaceae bacterium]
MIRSLTPDELPWFLARSFAYLGHRDPWGMAQRSVARLRDVRRDAARAWVLESAPGVAAPAPALGASAAPKAGVVAWPPDPDRDDPTLRFAQAWHDGDDPTPFAELVAELLRRQPHEAAELDLSALGPGRAAKLGAALAPLGFEPDGLRSLGFELAETPPLGRPLVLEGWRLAADAAFRSFVAEAEGVPLREGRWAWLKRAHGPFTPDLWFLAYETLDQPPVGYALAGRRRGGVDGELALTAVGVAQAHRGSTEMLRRLLLTLLHELAAESPVGRLRAEFSTTDAKLVAIMRSIGFEVGDVRPVLRRLPA